MALDRDRFHRLAARAAPDVGAAVVEATFRRLVDAYAAPERAYHNAAHIAHCLREWDAVADQAQRPVALELALWWHDAIYDPRGADNEGASADLAVRDLRDWGAPSALGDEVAPLILATRHDAAPDEPDARLLVDIDLAILGQPPERFDAYERAVRQEYAWVPEAIFRPRRAEIIERFLARPAIYQTPRLHRAYEAAARANLTRSLARLHAG